MDYEGRQLLKRSGGLDAWRWEQRTTKRWFLDLSLTSTCCGVGFLFLFLRLCVSVCGWLAPPPGWICVVPCSRAQGEHHIDLPTLFVNR